jgi:hypothetical protein
MGQSESLTKELEQTAGQQLFEQGSDKPPVNAAFDKALLHWQYLAISNAYIDHKATKSADDILRKAVDTIPDTSKYDTSAMLALLSKLRKAYEGGRDFQPAESLYEHVLDRLGKVSIEDATALSEIKMSLAEILLAHEKTSVDKKAIAALKKKSERLFDESIRSHNPKTVKAGASAADIKLRRIIATRYPSLVKLDLANGPVVYEEDLDRPGTRGGGICDGREVLLNGPFDVAIIGKGDGRLEIRLNGQTLSDKAISKMDKGELSAAENTFVAALRADPASESFSMLGECWYLQEKIENALEASSMALELDNRNAHAAAIQRLCRSDLKQASDKNRETDSLLNAAIAADSPEKPMTVALSLMAVGKPKVAVHILSNILKKEPGSYRASAFKAKCRQLKELK